MKELKNLRSKRIKHFKNDDGTITACIYAHDVHFKDKDDYKEIDNTLVDKNEYYENKKNEFKVKFNKIDNKLFNLTKDNHYVELSMISNNNLIPIHDKGKIKYNFNKYDIEYEIKNSKLKETIIISKKDNVIDKYEFLLKTNLDLVPNDNKSISLVNKKDILFTIMPSFMKDSRGKISYDVDYEIIKDNDYYLLSVVPNKEWLLSEERVYPVIIDPTILNGLGDNVIDGYIDSVHPNDLIATVDKFRVGCDETGVLRALLKFDLPEIPTGYSIVNARGYLKPDIGMDSVLMDKFRLMCVHELTTEYNESTASWNTMNDKYDSKIIDYFEPMCYALDESLSDDIICSFDMTKLVKGWYSGKPNNGVMIKYYDETLSENVLLFAFCSREYDIENGTGYRPYFTITYLDQSGLVSHLTYTDVSYDTGVTSVNNFNGNLIASFYLNKTIEGKMPIELSLNYNTQDVLLETYQKFKGWKFNYDEYIIPTEIDEIDALKYIDSTGHTIFLNKTDETFCDEEGLNLSVISDNNKYIMSDQNGNKKEYILNGNEYRLSKIIDTNNNEVNVEYTNGFITKITDADNETIELTYTDTTVTIVSDYETSVITLDNKLITSITTLDGTVTFDYNTHDLISKVIDVDGLYKTYTYYEVSPYKLKTISEFGISDNVGNSFTFTYSKNQTTITDTKGMKSVYTFDEYGRTTTMLLYPNDMTKLEDAIVLSNTYTNNKTNENKRLNNKLLTTSQPIMYVNNLLHNSGFEEEIDYNFDFTNANVVDTKSKNGIKSLALNNNATLSYQITESNDYTLSFDFFKTLNNSIIDLELYSKDENNNELLLDSIKINTYDVYDLFKRYHLTGYFNDTETLLVKFNSSLENDVNYIDDLQLEIGKSVNIRNMVMNSSLDDNLNGYIVNGNAVIVTMDDGVKAIKMANTPITSNLISQSLNVNGKAGESYNISFFYKNEGTSSKENAHQFKGNFVNVAFYYPEYGGGTYKEYLDNQSNEWQYYSTKFTAEYDFENINFSVLCMNEGNNLYITKLMIVKDEKVNSFGYDENGNISISSGLNDSVSSFTYDKNNEVTSINMSLGEKYSYEYDNEDTSKILREIYPTGVVEEKKYDEFGNIIKTKVKNINPSLELVSGNLYYIRCKGTNKYLTCNYNENFIRTLEDNCNKLSLVLIKEERDEEAEEDVYRIKISTKALTLQNNTIKLLDSNELDSLFYIHQNDNGSYSLLPRTEPLKRVSVSEDVIIVSDVTEEAETEFYFESIDTPLFIETNSYYTEDGKFITCVEDSLGNKTFHDVDPDSGLRKSMVGPNGVNTNYTYDEKNRMKSVSKNGKTVSYTYNNNNELSKISCDNKEYNFTYDDFLNLKTIKVNNRHLITNEYEESNGNLIRTTFGNGGVVNYDYDNLDRISNLTKGDKVYSYTYDKRGNASLINSSDEKYKYYFNLSNQITDYIFNDFKVTYEYDLNENVIEKKFNTENFEGSTLIYEYDKNQMITKVTIDNDVLNYNYDYLGRLTSKNVNDNLRVEYKYITNGNKTSVIVNSMKINDDIYKYTYDSMYNITHVYLNNELVNEYKYNKLNELIEDRNYSLNKLYQYRYDLNGNILSKREFYLDTHVLIKNDSYEYNDSTWKDLLTKFNDKTITYDTIGNPLTIGTANLTWKNGRELSSYNDTNLNVTYDYNLHGTRTSKTVNGRTTTYELEGNSIVIEKREDNVIYYLRDNTNNVIGFRYNNDTYYYKKNMQEDIIGIYDSSYNQIVSYTYDSWGKILSVKDSNGNEIIDESNIGLINPFRYRSYYYDTETNLYYLQTRYYNSEFGRFINADSELSTDTDGNNIFSYCENNPVSMVDANGKFPIIVAWVVGCTIAGAAVSFVSNFVTNLASGKKWSENWLGSVLGGATDGALAALGFGIGAIFAGEFVESAVNNTAEYIPCVSKSVGLKEPKKLTRENVMNSMEEIVYDTTVNGLISVAFSDFIKVKKNSGRYPKKIIKAIFGKKQQNNSINNLVNSLVVQPVKSITNKIYDSMKENSGGSYIRTRLNILKNKIKMLSRLLVDSICIM